MKAVCIDPAGTGLIKDQEYFVFPHGSLGYYVSKFDNEKAHMGCYQVERFTILEKVQNRESVPDPDPIEDFEQLSLFEDPEPVKKEVIPESVICPLECNKKPHSKEFKEVQRVWKLYVNAIEKSQQCSFFEARNLLFKHRDSQEPIALDFKGVK